MSIERCFKRLKDRGEGALISYIMGGDPRPDLTPKIAKTLVEGGADIIELGIPFSDPVADGPTIQAANLRALRSGTTPIRVLEIADQIKDYYNIPIVILTYYNIIFRMSLENFFDKAKKSKVDGIIVPDLPVEEAQDYKLIADKYGIDTIFLASPSTSIVRLKKIIEYTSGFLYLVSLFGVTGARKKLKRLTIRLIEKAIPYTKGKIPLAVGFGISQPYQVKSIIEAGADGAIVGSAFVEMIQKSGHDEDKMLNSIRNYTNELKRATILKGE
ncbi:MAG: tryptophan synthase subunit alpha [archaeon]|nr:tryptophan synthase subunit alpha [archaeon]